MPHLLIAGSTGSGKSVGINTIIASLLFKMHPKNLKFVIIDPKKVELQQYSRLENHFIAASPDIDDIIITNPKDAVIILKSLVAEMELRYDILASVGQRNIFDYNRKVREGKMQDNDIAHRPMPYIVVIIDELADLMLSASKEVEEPITRLAQMARAVGIHIVLATQRPSVDIITGIIKANFPARIAYLVAQKVDSRTILDISGAEQLLGNGDMLFLPNGSPKPIRIQNSFITTEEIEALCDFIGKQKGYSQPYMLPSLNEKKGSNGNGSDYSDRDPLFEEAARLVIRHQQGSVSLIQRRLKVGYARAGRIVDELERAGILGPHDGSKARQVLMTTEDELDYVI
jgi:S-DNA-T family DNA segregation ATPase FtsK/SpoIIIE